MQKNQQKAGLEALLRALAEEQTRKTDSPLKKTDPEKTPSSPEKRVAWFEEIAREQSSRESWEERQHYLYPPVIPEDVSRSILNGSVKGILDLAEDPIAASLMDSQEIRSLIRLGRLDPSELPLLKYRIDRIVGITDNPQPPGRREMLSSLAYHFRGDAIALQDIRREVLEELAADFESGDITQEETEKYRAELHQIIDQYLV